MDDRLIARWSDKPAEQTGEPRLCRSVSPTGDFQCTKPLGHRGNHGVSALSYSWADRPDKTKGACGAVAPKGGYVCTKPAGHSGDHESVSTSPLGWTARWSSREPEFKLGDPPVGQSKVNEFLSSPIERASLSVHQKFLLREVARRDNGETVCFMDDTFSTLEHLVSRGFVRVSDGDYAFSSARLTPEGYAAIGTSRVPESSEKNDEPGAALTGRERTVLISVRDLEAGRYVSTNMSGIDLGALVDLHVKGYVGVSLGKVVLTNWGKDALGVPRG